MTENVPQTSASDRIEAARKALEWYDDQSEAGGGIVAGGLAVADALRALITPPSVGESEATIAGRVLDDYFTLTYEEMVTDSSGETVYAALMAAARAGIQSAHERWEPADRPSQEQMLRWLGVTAEESVRDHDALFIPEQYIEREEI